MGFVSWKTSIWGLPCSHACCLSMCAPCALYYKVSVLLTGGTVRPPCGESLVGGCCCFGGLYQRELLREKYNLKGGECSDYWMHCCCQCFALGQVYREARAWAGSSSVCCPEAAAAAAGATPAGGAFAGGAHPNMARTAAVENASLVNVKPTTTERYDKLLEDIGALPMTNLGKNPGKTHSVAEADDYMSGISVKKESGELIIPTTPSGETKVLSNLANTLHEDFGEEKVDSQNLVMHPVEAHEQAILAGHVSDRSIGQSSGQGSEPTSSLGKSSSSYKKQSDAVDERLVKALGESRIDM